MNFLSGIGIKLAGVAVVLFAIVTAIVSAFVKGGKTATAKIKVKAATVTLKRVVKAKEIEDEVDKLDEDGVNAELADNEWLRNDSSSDR